MVPSSTRNTPLRVSPVTTRVFGSSTLVYQKSLTSSPRSTPPSRPERPPGVAPSTTRFGGPLVVEGQPDAAGIAGVVAQRDNGVQLVLARMDERAALPHGPGVETDGREEGADVGHTRRLEDDLVTSGR